MGNEELYCDQCGEVIKIGDEYVKIDFEIGYKVHEDCVDEFFDELQENSIDYKIRGREEE